MDRYLQKYLFVYNNMIHDSVWMPVSDVHELYASDLNYTDSDTKPDLSGINRKKDRGDTGKDRETSSLSEREKKIKKRSVWKQATVYKNLQFRPDATNCAENWSIYVPRKLIWLKDLQGKKIIATVPDEQLDVRDRYPKRKTYELER